MYARVTTFKVDPSRLAELSAKIKEMGPRAKALPGMVDAYGAWRGDGQGVVVAALRSKADADRAVAQDPGALGQSRRPAERRAQDRRLRDASRTSPAERRRGHDSQAAQPAASYAALACGRCSLPAAALDLVAGSGLAEQEALHLGAALGPDGVELLLGLDALGGRRHAEALAIAATARTMLSEPTPSAMSFTNERSILILSNGKLCR